MRKLPSRNRSALRRFLTVPNVLATLAVLSALLGTTVAATWGAKAKPRKPVQYTSAQIVNNSLLSADIRDRTLTAAQFASATRTQLKAKSGPVGPMGDAGPTGNQGAKGKQGAPGPDAVRAFSYITAEDTGGMISPKSGNKSNPDLPDVCDTNSTLPSFLGFAPACAGFGPEYPHWAWDCNVLFPKYCGFNSDKYGLAGAGATQLTSSAQGVVGFTGDANGSFVSLMRSGNILVTATMTFLTPESSEFHSRIMCQPQVRRSNTGDSYVNLGVPQFVSSDEPLELVRLTVTGARHFETAGDYDYQIACRNVDEYSTGQLDNWSFVSGNATATTTEM